VCSVSSDGESQSLRASNISFGSIQVREYERIVGDHPETRIGVPLGIGWAYFEHDAVSIDSYESTRVSRGIIRMSSITRKNILHQVFGIPEEDLRGAEKEIQKIQKSRAHSNKQGKISAHTGSAVKGLRRKMQRALSTENFFKGLSAASGSFSMAFPMAVQS
jgi:hypothetical protein